MSIFGIMSAILRIIAYVTLLCLLLTLPTYSQISCTPSGCYGSNQIIFGDFENFTATAPFADFTSDYTFNGPCITGGNGCGNYLCQYSFAVSNQLTPCNITWSSNIQDHTSGSGNMMVVDFPNNGPEQKIWCTQITLEPNKEYCFGAWFINLLTIGSNQGQPAFTFRVNGNSIFNSPTVPEDEQWHFYGSTFNTGAGGSTELCIYNANWGFLGYDVAIDDIILREILTGQEPLLENDTAFICQGSNSITINVLQNDVQGINPDLDSTTLSIAVAPAFTQGLISDVNTTNGTITFTPSASFTGSASFQYSVCNTAGCCSQAFIIISSAPTPIVSVNASPSIICSGNSTVLSANGAASFSWSPTSSVNSSTGATVNASPNFTTTYTIVGTNNSGCTVSSTLVVTVVPQPQINLSVYDTSICQNQAINVTTSGSNTFIWTPNFNQMPLPFQYTLLPLVNTTYTITAISGNCTKDTFLTVQVFEPPVLSAVPASPLSICFGNSALVSINGADNIIWDPSSSVTINSNNAILYPATSITYTVVGYDANNCSSSLNYSVDVITRPQAIINCPGEICVGNISIQNNSQNATSYQWFVNGSYQNNDPSLYYNFTDTGIILISLVADNNNYCFDTSYCLTQVNPIPVIQSVSASAINNSFSANIYLQSSGADDCLLILNNDTINLLSCDSTSLLYEFTGSGTQQLYYLITNVYGCSAQYDFTVKINDATFIFVPNAFSPNSDGINDIFIPWFIKTPSLYLMSIYDRWGKKVFESNSIELGWDGNYINGPASIGVYVYVIQYALPGYNESKVLKGNISLLR